jgi:hypothetical protein
VLTTTAIAHDLTPAELERLDHLLRTRGGLSRWQWIHHKGRRIAQPELRITGQVITSAGAADGTSPSIVVRAILNAVEDVHARRSEAAIRAAATRATRQQRRVYEAARRLRDHALTPRTSCRICGRPLSDQESRARGIGTECWQAVLTVLNDGDVTITAGRAPQADLMPTIPREEDR